MTPINENKRKIYEAAEELFYEKGYIDTTLNDIIKRSKTNKGLFYHYYKNKAELGLAVLLDMHHQHISAVDLFPEEDSLVLLALENRVLWYTRYQDKNTLRFSRDLNYESLHQESRYIYDPCFEHTNRRFSQKEFALVVNANIGVRRNMALYVYDNMERYTFDEPSSFYLRELFRLFYIDDECISYTLKRSLDLLEQLDIVVDKFKFYVSLKEDSTAVKNQDDSVLEK